MPKPRATLKQSPADFRVAEQIDFPLTGHGEHLWCYVEKTGLNTAWLKREWARLTDCPPKDIAHSGLKDRHAITRQWLSLPATARQWRRLADSRAPAKRAQTARWRAPLQPICHHPARH